MATASQPGLRKPLQQWYLETGGKRQGPYSLTMLKTAFDAGKIQAQSILITAEEGVGAIEKRLTVEEALREAATSGDGLSSGDATMTLFDALQATKTTQRKIVALPQVTVMGAAEPQGSRLDPRLLIALGITVVVSVGVWGFTQRNPSTTQARTTTYDAKETTTKTPPSGSNAVTPTATSRPSLFGSKTPPPLPKTQTVLPPRGFSNAAPVSAPTAATDLEKERERDREYEREREREKRRQMEAWKRDGSGGIGTAGDDSNTEAARGYKDPAAVIRQQQQRDNPEMNP